MKERKLERLGITTHDLFSGIRPNPSYKGDSQYEDTTITKVQRGQDYFDITMNSGWSCGFPAHKGIEPRVGQTLRIWGEARWGGTIRGMAIVPASGHLRIGFYRTPDEDLIYHQVSVLMNKLNAYLSVYENLTDTQERIEALPLPFRRRLEHFRDVGGVEFMEHQGYELFCCEQAVVIANAFETPDEIKAFNDLDWKVQVEAVPGLSDGHSGNTFGNAVHMAWAWKSGLDASIYARDDGALAPLHGSYRSEADQLRQGVRMVIDQIQESASPRSHLSQSQITGMLKEIIGDER